jgi:hypothetical protein
MHVGACGWLGGDGESDGELCAVLCEESEGDEREGCDDEKWKVVRGHFCLKEGVVRR